MVKSSTCLFSLTMVTGLLISVSSSSWFGVWLGLELNLLSFIPIMMMSVRSVEVEAGLKYFLIQACGSIILLYSGVYASSFLYSMNDLIFISLALKLGLAPLHFWFPMVAEGLSWVKVFILSTVQKLGPLTLMFYLNTTFSAFLISLVILLSGIVGALGGINEMFLRKLFSFSSINHMGWVVLAMWGSSILWLSYFALYSAIFGSVVMICGKFQLFSMEQIFNKSIPLVSQMSLFIGVISLGGLPPLLGFLPKWMVIQELAGWISGALMLSLLMTNLVTLYYYLRVSMKFTLNKSFIFKVLSYRTLEKELVTLLVNLFGLLVVGVVWLSLLH